MTWQVPLGRRVPIPYHEIGYRCSRMELEKVPWNYYPKGRVKISHGRALVFMNPQILNCENFLERIQETFGIGHLDIQVKIDNSAHYQCTILEH